MKYFHRIAQGVDVSGIMTRLAHNPQFWHADTYLRDYPQGPFGEVDSIICRFPPRSVKASQALAERTKRSAAYKLAQHECIDLPIFDKLPEVRLAVWQIMNTLHVTRLGRVMINRMMPGGHIFRHADTPDHADYWLRHHLVLQSAPGAVFTVGDEKVYMATGEFWYFNNGKAPDRPAHEVFNNSGTERIHLIVDVRTT